MFSFAHCFSLLVKFYLIPQDSRSGTLLLDLDCILELDLWGTYQKHNVHYIWVNKLCKLEFNFEKLTSLPFKWVITYWYSDCLFVKVCVRVYECFVVCIFLQIGEVFTSKNKYIGRQSNKKRINSDLSLYFQFNSGQVLGSGEQWPACLDVGICCSFQPVFYGEESLGLSFACFSEPGLASVQILLL